MTENVGSRNQSVKSIQDQVDEFTVSMQSTMTGIAKKISDWAEQISDSARRFLTEENLQIVNRYMEELKKLEVVLPLELRKRGWYLPYDAPAWLALDAYVHCRTDKLDAFMEQAFEENLDELERIIVERFPHRAHILREAFSAHREEKYCLSIPVFLAQADGGFSELIGKENSLFVDGVCRQTK